MKKKSKESAEQFEQGQEPEPAPVGPSIRSILMRRVPRKRNQHGQLRVTKGGDWQANWQEYSRDPVTLQLVISHRSRALGPVNQMTKMQAQAMLDQIVAPINAQTAPALPKLPDELPSGPAGGRPAKLKKAARAHELFQRHRSWSQVAKLVNAEFPDERLSAESLRQLVKRHSKTLKK